MSSLATKARENGSAFTPRQQKVIAALRRYASLYGEGSMTAAAFSPSTAKWRDEPVLVERYYAGDPETGSPWPSLNALKAQFGGSFNAARLAAGLPPNRPGPAKGRRESHKHQPIRGVSHVGATRRIVEVHERVVEDTARIKELQRDVRGALARAQRAEKALGRLRGRPAIVKPVVSQSAAARLGAAREQVKELRAEVRGLRRELAAASRVQQEFSDQAGDLQALRAKLNSNQTRMDALLLEADGLRAEAAGEREAREAAEAALELADEGTMRATQAEVEAARMQVSEAAEAARESERAAIAARRERDKAAGRAESAERAATAAEERRREVESAIAGTDRRLTPVEIEQLKVAGPAGPAVLAAALKSLAKARATGNGDMSRALSEVAAAAMRWKDRL